MTHHPAVLASPHNMHVYNMYNLYHQCSAMQQLHVQMLTSTPHVQVHGLSVHTYVERKRQVQVLSNDEINTAVK